MFNSQYMPTIGVDFKLRKHTIKGRMVKHQMWDVAGPERFRTITSAYYRGAHIIFSVFDLTDMDSFLNCTHWLSQIQLHGSKTVLTVLVGTKVDLTEQRVVSREAALQLAKEHGLPYYEISSKEDIGLTKMIMDALRNRVRQMMHQRAAGSSGNSNGNSKASTQQKAKKSCSIS